MNEEPIEVRLARMLLAADLGSEWHDDAERLRRDASAVVNAYEGSLAHRLKQEEERQRAKDETAKRWPELAAKGYWYSDGEYYCTMHRSGHNDVCVNKEDNEVTIDGYGDEGGGLTANSAVVLALIDAAGQNTTANKLRAAIDAALDTKGISSNVALVLQRALEQ